jgi:thioredoxin-like negative regulator of GroEL
MLRPMYLSAIYLFAVLITHPAESYNRYPRDRERLISGAVNVLTSQADFDDVVVSRAKGAPVIVDFYASWCGPCRQLAPYLDLLAREYSGRVWIIRVDVDRNFSGRITKRLDIKSIPMLAVITRDHVGLISGALPIAELRELIRSYLVSSEESKTTEPLKE